MSSVCSRETRGGLPSKIRCGRKDSGEFPSCPAETRDASRRGAWDSVAVFSLAGDSQGNP